MNDDHRQAGADSADPLGLRKGGSAQVHNGRGVWVPDGMNAAMILVGAKIIQKEFDVGEYTARSIAREIWAAMNAVSTKVVKS